MAIFTWFDGNQGIYDYASFNAYTVTQIDAETIVWELADPATYDPTTAPYTIVMTVTDGESLTYDTGPMAGDSVLVDGTVTEISYYDDEGNLVLQVTGLDASAAAVSGFIAAGSLYGLGEYLLGGGHEFVGSGDASGPDRAEDGDVILTGAGDDTVTGGAGNDYVSDAGGKDIYDLGDGAYDELSYDAWFYTPGGAVQGISANLRIGKVMGPDGVLDTVSGVEKLRGTFLDDLFTGDRGNNSFMGYAGADEIRGGLGSDMVQYQQDVDQGGFGGCIVDLAAEWAQDGFGTIDTLKSIESAIGTGFDDSFTGNDSDNWFRGLEGADLFVFSGSDFGFDTIDDFSRIEGDKIQIAGAASIDDLTITYDPVNAYVAFGAGTVAVANWVALNPGVALGQDDFVF